MRVCPYQKSVCLLGFNQEPIRNEIFVPQVYRVYKYHICALQSRKVYFYLTNQESTFGLYSLRKYIFTLQSRRVHLCFTVQESTFVFYSLGKYICILQSKKVHLYFTVQESTFVFYSLRKYIFDVCTAVGLAFSCQTSDIFPFPLFLDLTPK